MTGPFDAIQDDPDVCNNCFRRTHERYDREYAVDWVWNPSTQEYDFWPRPVERGITRRRRPAETDRIPAGDRHGMRTICECGVRHVPEDEREGDWKIRPLPKDLFFDYAEILAERVRELGYYFDSYRYEETLAELKSHPEWASRDDDIFRRAVGAATAEGGTESGVPTPPVDM